MPEGPDTQVPLLARPYFERQRILVVSSPVSADQVKVAPRGTRGAVLATMAAATVLAGGVLVGGPVREVAARAAAAQLSRARERGLDVLPVSRDEAASLAFPPGHPKVGRVLYIGHPELPTVYYPAAHFHRMTFEHKLSEAIRLLMALGATKIEAERGFGWTKEFAANLNVPVGMAGETGGGKLGHERGGSQQILFSARLKNTATPRVPEGLIWYPHETTWQTVADARLNHGLEEFSLTVSYEDNFGVDASLKAAVAGTHIALGGEFGAHEATLWRLVGTFAPMPDWK
jgi:hypothetical protein